MMLRVKPKSATGKLPQAKVATAAGGGGGCSEAAAVLEVRPCGMLVQKRNSDTNQSSTPVPTIKVKVKYGSSCHEITISSQASFGVLKKMLAGPTGLHPQDQKLMYKDKERESKSYLDVSGVKNGSKIELIEDVLSRERQCLELRNNANMEKASKEIKGISSEVDKLAKEVAKLEREICGGKKVVETVLLNLIELLMTQLIKLDGIVADGDVKLQRRMQVKRVQKYIETLDMLKARNSMVDSNKDGSKVPFQQQKQMILTGPIPLPVDNQLEHRNLTRQKPLPMEVQHEQRKQRNSTWRNPLPIDNQQDQRKQMDPIGQNPFLMENQQEQGRQRNLTWQIPLQMVNQQEQRKHWDSEGQILGSVVVTKNWETFDSGVAVKLPLSKNNASTIANSKLIW